MVCSQLQPWVLSSLCLSLLLMTIRCLSSRVRELGSKQKGGRDEKCLQASLKPSCRLILSSQQGDLVPQHKHLSLRLNWCLRVNVCCLVRKKLKCSNVVSASVLWEKKHFPKFRKSCKVISLEDWKKLPDAFFPYSYILWFLENFIFNTELNSED